MTEAQRVIEPGGYFVFDLLVQELPLAEDWAILETYLGALGVFRACRRVGKND
jgi:hypothetical protein